MALRKAGLKAAARRPRQKKRLMTKLSVNVNKIATLRNARGKNIPDLTAMARLIIESGAGGLTVHPRPDERHIRRSDVPALKQLTQGYKNVECNIEGFPSKKFLDLMAETLPDQCSLVPDPPHVLTSNAGWKLSKSQSLLKSALGQLKKRKIRTSLFLDPFAMDEREWETLAALQPDRIELYTEAYARSQGSETERALSVYKQAARKALRLNIGVNAGHDLNQANLPGLLRALPEIQEVSIGQALIAEALEKGLKATVRAYLKIIQSAC